MIIDLAMVERILKYSLASDKIVAAKRTDANSNDHADGHDGAGGAASFRVNVTGVIDRLKKKLVLDTALSRYNKAGKRLLALFLQDGDWICHDDIADRIVMRQTEAKKALYAMYKDGWVECREVSRRADFTASSTKAGAARHPEGADPDDR